MLRQRGSLRKQRLGIDVLRGLLKNHCVEPQRLVEVFEADALDLHRLAVTFAHHGHLLVIRRDPEHVVARTRQPRQRRADAHTNVEQPRRRVRQALDQHGRRPLLRLRNRFVRRLEEAVMQVRNAPFLMRQNVHEGVERIVELAVGKGHRGSLDEGRRGV